MHISMNQKVISWSLPDYPKIVNGSCVEWKDYTVHIQICSSHACTLILVASHRSNARNALGLKVLGQMKSVAVYGDACKDVEITG